MSKFAVTRIALLTAAAAFFAAACATESTAPTAKGPSIKSPLAGVYTAARTVVNNVEVCIAPGSPAGTYVVNATLIDAPPTGSGTLTPTQNLVFPGVPCVIVYERTAKTPNCVFANTICDYPQTVIGASVVAPSNAIAQATAVVCDLDSGTEAPDECVEPDGTAQNDVAVRVNFFHGTQAVFSFASSDGLCVLPNSNFGLGSAGAYTLLGLTGNNFDIGSGDTFIFGDVGLGPNNTGTIKKATIDGNLFKHPLIPITVVSDLKVLGSTFTADLLGASAAAISASTAAAVLANTIAPILPPYNNLTGNTTITGVAGLNVLSIQSVNMTGKTITFAGPADAVFIINVLGAFNFRSSVMSLGNVAPHNILWNFVGPTGDVTIKDPSTRAAGVFLVPNRNFNGDKASFVGSIFVGKTAILHSGTQLICEKRI